MLALVALLGGAACSSTDVGAPGSGESRRGPSVGANPPVRGTLPSDPKAACKPETPPIVCDLLRYRLRANDPGPLTQYAPDCLDLPEYVSGMCTTYAIDPASYAPGTWALCCFSEDAGTAQVP
ncbi:MAG TPA: hypothetical protein VIF15_16285 [Polyangiaceae bacterium]